MADQTEFSRCPDEVAQAVLEIIRWAVLSIRVAGWRGDANYCAIEADHIHNLPDLLSNYKPDKLDYYLRIERLSYLSQVHEALPNVNAEAYQAQWQRLEQYYRGQTA